MKIKVVVACTNAGGEPDFYPCEINVPHTAYEEGDHYELAKVAAEEDLYRPPFVCFDEKDGPAWLFEKMWPDGWVFMDEEDDE